MLPQYKLVAVNIILSVALTIGLIIYKYIFPKRKINLFYLLILISILPIVSIFRIGSYESGDLSLHTTRLISFFNLFFNYHLIPRWTPEFNVGYGDPHFLFAYFLPYLIGSIFHFIGFSFLISIKLLLAISFIFSGATMYFWVKEELGKKSGFVAAIFYLFMPYHLVDMHFRVTIAENLSFVFLPLILLAVGKTIEKCEKKWFFAASTSFALLILSHQTIALTFLPIMLSYGTFVWLRKNNRTIKEFIYGFISILFGLLISSFYWIPIVFLAKFTQQGSNPTPISFPQLADLIYSPWRLGLLFQGHKGELSYLIGYIQLLIIGLSLYLLIQNKINKNLKRLLVLFLTTFAILLLMLLPFTRVLWENSPFLKYSQFSTRLLVPLSLSISLIAGIVVSKFNKNWFIATLCFLTISYTILNWGNRRTIPVINDDYLKKEFSVKPDVSGLEPTSPIWANLNKSKLRTKPRLNMEVIKGKATIEYLSRSPISHTYRLNAKSKVELKENTLFFPGWTVTANNQPLLINYKNPKAPGAITFNLDKGMYNIDVRFTDLPIITFSKWLSGLSLFGMLIFIFIPKKLNFPKL